MSNFHIKKRIIHTDEDFLRQNPQNRELSCFFFVFPIKESFTLKSPNRGPLNRKIALLTLLMIPSLFLRAEEEKKTPRLLNLGAGVYDIIHDPHNFMLQVEYRSFIKKFHYARPLVGLMGTDKATFYFYAGMACDIFLGSKVALTPSFAPGLYLKGFGKNLHFPLEFRSSMELSYILPNQGRIGGQFYHISNASFGPKNPGAEALVFFYSVPL